MPYTDEELMSLICTHSGRRVQKKSVVFDEHTEELADLCLGYLRNSMDAIMDECYRLYEIYDEENLEICLAAALSEDCFPENPDEHGIAEGLMTPAWYDEQKDCYQGAPSRFACLDISVTGVEVDGSRELDFGGWWCATRILSAVNVALRESGYPAHGIPNPNPAAFYPFIYDDDGSEWTIPVYQRDRLIDPYYCTGFARYYGDIPDSAQFLILSLV